MELEEFDISINRAEKRDDKIYYVILVQYKDLKYEINKRFSEFEQLQCELLHFGFSALPNLPAKKLMSYTNTDYINFRKKKLHVYLQDLFTRPDIRCCSTFLNFFNFYDKINLPVDVTKTKLINSIGSQKFSLSDFYVNEKASFIICVYEDRSNMSKLGKLWSIIEPDIIGQIKIFSYNNDVSSTFVEKHKVQTIFKARNISYEEDKNLAVVSGDDGNIYLYKVDIESLQMKFVKNIHFHNDNILYMMKVKDIFCTCGYDNAFRIFLLKDKEDMEQSDGETETEIDIKENEMEFKIISGGRCSKRLDNGKITTCHLLEYNNLVLGTDNSLFIIYNLSNNPPIYLDTKKIKNGKKINCFTSTDKYLFMGYDNIIACYNYHYITPSKNTLHNNTNIINNKKGANTIAQNIRGKTNNITNENYNEYNNGNEVKTQYLVVDNNISAQYISPLMYDNQVLCMCIDKNKKILYAGYEDAIIIWSIVHGLIISSFHGHTGGVLCLTFLKSADCLLSGGKGGNLKIWKSKIDNYEFWKPKKKIKGTNEGKIKYANNRVLRNVDVNQNNFFFDENETDYNTVSERDKCSSNSDAMSIDSLINHNEKEKHFQIYDTSNYKKDIISYNRANDTNNTSSIHLNNAFDNDDIDADIPPTLPLFDPNRNTQMNSIKYITNSDIKYNDFSVKGDIFENDDLKNSESNYLRQNKRSAYDFSTNVANANLEFSKDLHAFNFGEKHQIDNAEMKNEGMLPMSYNTSNIHFMDDLNKENQLKLKQQIVTDNDNNGNFNQETNYSNMRKNVVYASEEDDDDDNNEDLIGAFN